jgi:hypothetical protein
MLYRLGEWTMTSMQIGVRTYLLAVVAGDFPVMGPHDQRNLAASTVSFYGALKVKPLAICFPWVSYLR